jgi:hypothetical protein
MILQDLLSHYSISANKYEYLNFLPRSNKSADISTESSYDRSYPRDDLHYKIENYLNTVLSGRKVTITTCRDGKRTARYDQATPSRPCKNS